jgi:manganese-dependent inorganic pyrophosphatase
MIETIVTGHKNPDTDSACAAWCYALLKRVIDPSERYRAVVCGSLNQQTRFVFEKAGVEPPELMKDAFPRAIDVARNDGIQMNVDDPVYDAVRSLDENTVSVIPVFRNGDAFSGIIGIHEVATYVMKSGVGRKQRYIFNTDNFERVIPGYYLKKGPAREFSAPIMIGAMDYEKSAFRMEELMPEKPVLVVGNRLKIIEHAVAQQLPAIILTNAQNDPYLTVDISGFEGSVYCSFLDTAETVRLLWLSAPVKHIMNTEPMVLRHDEIFEDAKRILLGSDHRGLPVIREGRFAGVVTRRSFIEKPKRRLILVDHNEAAQSINGAGEADIREIIDHHRLAADKTASPIYVFAKPVGSTCTLIYQHFLMHNAAIDRTTALLLLSGILSDTLFLKSPTTTHEDKRAAEECAWIAGEDIQHYSAELLSKMTILRNADPMKIVSGDFKIYREFGIGAGIAQVETVSLEDVTEMKPRLLAAMETLRQEKSLDWVLLLVTDVVHEHSQLLCTPHAAAERELLFARLSESLYDLPGILSRKKQLLPEILRVLEEVSLKRVRE